MCGGATFVHHGQAYRIYFPNPAAVLPVRLKSGEHDLLPWGRRKSQSGHLPLGGWARLDSIYAGKWEKWFPKAVKLDVSSFMEKDYAGKSHWFDLQPTNYIQGLLARDGNERRIYVVTIQPDPDICESIHDRWPRIMFD